MDDVLYQVYLVTQILDGLEDAEAGRLLSTDELLEKVEESVHNSLRCYSNYDRAARRPPGEDPDSTGTGGRGVRATPIHR